MRARTAVAIACAAIAGCASVTERTSREATTPHALGRIGVTSHLGHGDYYGLWDSAKTSRADRELYFGLLAGSGATFHRDLYCDWAAVQPTRSGAYDFALSDEMVSRAAHAGIGVVALCWGSPIWAVTDENEKDIPPGARAGLRLTLPRRSQQEQARRFFYDFVERYDGDGLRDMPGLTAPIKHYQFWDDPPDPDAYAFWLRAFWQEAKAADGEVRVVAAGLSISDGRLGARAWPEPAEWLDALLESPNLGGPNTPGWPFFDAVALKLPHQLDSADAQMAALGRCVGSIRELLAARGALRPVWLVEYGIQEDAGGGAEQAAAAVKTAVGALSLGVERVAWASLWDLRVPGGGADLRVGLLAEAAPAEAPNPKPAYAALRTLAEALEGARTIENTSPGIYRIQGPQLETYVCWDAGRDTVPPWNAADRLAITDMYGTASTAMGQDVLPGAAPVYVRPSGASAP